MELKKASRSQVKIRMSVAAPTGFGKTIASLLIAFGITKDWSKIAVVDTENESASLYADHTIQKTKYHIGEFNTIALAPPFTPEKYTEAIRVCEAAGMEVIILDSVTHVWSGQGGLLDSNNQLGGTFQSWAKTTPRYQKWLDSILHSSAHIITTNRKKQSYNITTEGGKTKVEKVGMEDQIRDGYDYEMTIAFEIMNKEHLCFAGKDRTGLFAGIPEFVISEETGTQIKEWCESGKVPAKIDYEAELKACTTLDALKNKFLSLPESKKVELTKLTNELKAKLTPAPATPEVPLYMADKDYKAFLTRLKKSGEPEYIKAKEFSDFTAEQETEIANILAGMKSAA